MDRYTVFQAWENIDTDPNGEWVKYSDVEALQARVRELEEALLEISRNQIPYGTYTPDAGEDIQIVHMRMSAWQLLHGIGYELNTKGTP